MGPYARGELLPAPGVGIDSDGVMDVGGSTIDREVMDRYLTWYLLCNGVPVSTLLAVLRQLARDAHAQCTSGPPPEGTSNAQGLDVGIEVLHVTGTRMTLALGSGRSVRSLNEIIEVWKVV